MDEYTWQYYAEISSERFFFSGWNNMVCCKVMWTIIFIRIVLRYSVKYYCLFYQNNHVLIIAILFSYTSEDYYIIYQNNIALFNKIQFVLYIRILSF